MKDIVFLCGARDYHAFDWYKLAKKIFIEHRVVILTDLIGGEGFKVLISEADIVYRLFIIDRLLFRAQTRLGDVWRNLIKLIVLPLQIILLRRFLFEFPNSIFHAHSMYYIWLAAFGNLQFVGTPQGSDILVKPWRSWIYRRLSIFALNRCKHITVDSTAMVEGVRRLCGREAILLQNGIAVSEIEAHCCLYQKAQHIREGILSVRGGAPLYRIKDLVLARNKSTALEDVKISFIYPFWDEEYINSFRMGLKAIDSIYGRVDRKRMYEMMYGSKLVVSIPSSDSSPRSVYEAIFCGAIVAVTYHSYVDLLPSCMRRRIIVVDLEDTNWLDKAYALAAELAVTDYIPTQQARIMFDQDRSIAILKEILL